MSVLTVLAFAALGLASGAVGQADAGLRTEARVRQGSGVDTSELEADPIIGLGIADPAGEATIHYAPRLLLQKGIDTPAVLHRVDLEASLQASRLWMVRGTVRGAVGTTDLVLDQGSVTGAPGPIQPVPTSARLPVVGAALAVSVEGDLSRRLHLRSALALSTDGGQGPQAQAQFPQQRVARLGAYLEHVLSRHDVGAVEASVSATSLPPASVNWLGTLGFTWRRRIEKPPEPAADPEANGPQAPPKPREVAELPELWLGAGGAVEVLDASGSVPTRWQPYPTGEAGYRSPLGGSLEASLMARFAPVVDRYDGLADPRLDSNANLTWRPTRSWLLGADGTWGVVVGGVRKGERVGGAGVHVAYTTESHWELSVGTRSWDQRGGGVMPSHFLWGFVSLAYADRKL
jgi:hypothetical protein